MLARPRSFMALAWERVFFTVSVKTNMSNAIPRVGMTVFTESYSVMFRVLCDELILRHTAGPSVILSETSGVKTNNVHIQDLCVLDLDETTIEILQRCAYEYVFGIHHLLFIHFEHS